MRPAQFARMLIALTVVLALRTHDCFARGPHNGAKAQPAEEARPQAEVPEHTWEVEAFGNDQQGAIDAANIKTVNEVMDYLHSFNPPIDWPQMQTYIQDKINRKLASTTKGEGPVQAVEGKFKSNLTVTFDKNDFEDLLQHDRQYRAEQRQLGLLKYLGGFLVVLVTGTVLFRVRAPVKGTSAALWMKLGVVGTLGALGVGAGWWLLS